MLLKAVSNILNVLLTREFNFHCVHITLTNLAFHVFVTLLLDPRAIGNPDLWSSKPVHLKRGGWLINGARALSIMDAFEFVDTASIDLDVVIAPLFHNLLDLRRVVQVAVRYRPGGLTLQSKRQINGFVL